jgi:hypothetical protein
MTVDARESIDALIIALTVKYHRKFTISQAINRAAEDLYLETIGELLTHGNGQFNHE